EGVVQDLAHGRPGGMRLRAGDMALDVGGEDDFGHRSPRRGPPPRERGRRDLARRRLPPRTSGGRGFRQPGARFYLWPAGNMSLDEWITAWKLRAKSTAPAMSMSRAVRA